MPNSNLQLEIVSPQGVVFQGEVTSVGIPTFSGRITILPHHASLFTKLSEGEVEIHDGSREQTIIISGGFLEVKNNVANILSDYAIRAESIKQAESEEKKRMAEGKLKQKLTNREFTSADKDLRMSILELKVAQKVRHKVRTSE